MKPHVIQIVGYKNSGKTTLIEQLIGTITDAGYTVGTVKHDAHDFDIDHDGTDTWRHRHAGAQITAISSPWRTAMVEGRSASLDELLQRMQHMDVVLVEGFKKEKYPKIVMVRTEEDMELVQQLHQVIAVVTWIQQLVVDVPVFSIHDTKKLTEWMLEQFS